MSFYIVPAMSYQQQQKQKVKHKSRKNDKSKQRRSSVHEKVDTVPRRSISTVESLGSLTEVGDRGGSERECGSISPSSRSHTNISSKVSQHDPDTNNGHSNHSRVSKSFKLNQRSSNDFSSRSSLISETKSLQDNAFTDRQGQVNLISNPVTPVKDNVDSSQFSEPQPDVRVFDGSLVRDYVVFTDLSALNSDEGLSSIFLNPVFARQRFRKFLDLIIDHHVNDPINFASVREQSLAKFVNRQKFNNVSQSKSEENAKDIQFYENLLAHRLLKCRGILRRLIDNQTKTTLKKSPSATCEELIQGNFINYIRYLITLPELQQSDRKKLSEIIKDHFEMKDSLLEINKAFYTLKKDGYENELGTSLSSMQLLLQVITKSSYEFILLESYLIQILVKLNKDLLIESRIAKRLFDLFNLNFQFEKKESLKVLVFNTYFSVNYSWYLAVTIPFVRVFEASIMNESQTSLDGQDEPRDEQSDSIVIRNFAETDCVLYEKFFKNVRFSDFAEFSKTSRKELVDFHLKCSPNDLGGSSNNCVKPLNFEYYSQSLRTIPSETFHAIQCRDLQLQLSNSNYKQVLRQFHRILKTGGILELPLLVPGQKKLKDYGHLREGFPNSTQFMQLDISGLAMTSNFILNLFEELKDIFGSENIMFSSVVLTTKNEMIKFLINHTLMKLHEIIGIFNEFCQNYSEGENCGSNDEVLNFYFYIRAEKA